MPNNDDRRCASLLALAVALAIAGCGSGVTPGGGSGGIILPGGGSLPSTVDDGREFGGATQSVAAYRDKLTPDEAYHLLRRAAFGATPEQVSQAVQRGLTATVDDLLTLKPVPAALTALADGYEDDMPRKWLIHLIESPNPLHERVALFWHDRFATSRRVALDGRTRPTAILHWEMLRRNALGDYRRFLEELTIDPLMLLWLDGANSPKENPNENYTREFWELFTLGRDVLYDEEDIREGARAFTGITLLYQSGELPRPIYDLLHHDETTKTIFPGRSNPYNHSYQTVIDLTLEQPEAARYVARNLFVCFVHDEPSGAVVQELADLFVESDFHIAPLVRRILRSQAMFSSTARGGQITSPVEHFVGYARTLDMHAYSEESQTTIMDRIARELRFSGHELLNPPGVEGWGEDEYWLQDQSLMARAVAFSRVMEFGPDHTPLLPMHLFPPVAEWTDRDVRKQMVDALAGVFHLKLTEEEREAYIEVLDQNGWRALHLETPENQPRYVLEMMKLMAMHEGVITR
jgi:hypothetical protein